MDSGTCAGVPLGVPLGVDPSVDTRRALVADSWLRPNHSLVRMCHFGSCCLVGLSSLVISLTCTALWLGRFSAMFDFVKLSEGRFAKLHTPVFGCANPSSSDSRMVTGGITKRRTNQVQNSRGQ